MDTDISQSISKVWVFGKESVAWVDGVRFRLYGDCDKLADIGEIVWLVEQNALIGVDGMIRIFGRVNGDGVDSKVSCRS